MSRLLPLVLACAGCGVHLVDPCQNVKGTCLTLQIDPSPAVTQVDALRVHVDPFAAKQTPVAGGRANLPVALAVVFDSAPGLVVADVDGLLRGATVGHGRGSVALRAGQHSTLHVSLAAGTAGGDGGSPGIRDLAASDAMLDSGAEDLAFAGGNDVPDLFGADLMPIVPVVPSHVTTMLDSGAADLPSGTTTIDTAALTINGAAPPAGVRFVEASGHSDWAVLYIGGWDVTQPVTVSGTRALIVLASRPVFVGSVISASATTMTAGPGGQATGAGVGGNGGSSGDSDAGGGGGGFGSAGAAGGMSDMPAATVGAPGMIYGAALAFFGGGSAGGNGGGQTLCSSSMPYSRGGGGGGAIQITSAVSITIAAAGGINVGGGGGTAGCGAASAGGGGGSGGLIFLESPEITVTGRLAANGGAGGGGGSGNGNTDGMPGGDGSLSATPATGGMAGPGGFLTASNGGNGGNGAAGSVAATSGQTQTNSGGSGGGVGRVWLRSRGTPASVTGMISPAAVVDTSL